MESKTESKTNRIWIVISVVAILIATLSVYWVHTYKTQLIDIHNENSKLLAMIEEIMKSERRPIRSEMPFVLNEEIELLKKKGLKDPVNDLVNNLLVNAEMIPFEGVAGGTMSFYNPKQIYILNDHWAVAYFEDGHIGGHALLKFNVIDQDSIEWTLMDAYLY